VEPQEAEAIIRHLVTIAAHQEIMKERLDLLNQRLAAALRRLGR
jgi:hypothetical protein